MKGSLSILAIFMAVFSLEAYIPASGQEVRVACELRYRPDGKFKILQLTDTHYVSGDSRSERALANVIRMLDEEKPDFVIHTGDIVFGAPAGQSAKELLQPLVDRKIPFAVALGNHDSDFDLSRTEIFSLIHSIPGNVNTPDDLGISGCSNELPIAAHSPRTTTTISQLKTQRTTIPPTPSPIPTIGAQ